MAKQTFTQVKKELVELKDELKRVKKKDFYQGAAWGATIATILILILYVAL